MDYVVVTVNLKSASVVCVDGPFLNDCEGANRYAEAQNADFSAREISDKYRSRAEVVTKPQPV